MAKRSKTGTALKGAGVTLLIVGVILGFVGRAAPAELAIFFFFVPVLAVIAGAFLFLRGRQYSARAMAPQVIGDEKPDVLYLRSFRSDPSAAGQVFGALLTPRLMSGLATEEEQLAEVLKPFGDLVAVGQPGESLPKPGAARMYAADDEWKELVQRQMRDARLVVLRAGSGEGVLWELGKAVELLEPKKLLIFAFGMKKKHYRAFRAEAEPILGTSLPKADAMKNFGRVSGFILFSENWQPTALPLRAPLFRRSVYKPSRPFFKNALKPVFDDFGLEWKPPPIGKFMVFAFMFFAAFALLILAALFSSC